MLPSEQHRASLVIDGAGEGVGQRRHERKYLDVDVRALLPDRPLPLPIDVRESEQRARFVSLQRKPVPFRWFAFVGLAECRLLHPPTASAR